jgi:acyl-CoA synthetase (AMP-forming)/AMP-acid ligase II
MHIDSLLERFAEAGESDAMVWRETAYSYRWLLDQIAYWTKATAEAGLQPGAVVSLEADFTPAAVALLFALIDHSSIVVPLTGSVETMKSEFRTIAEVECSIGIGADERAEYRFTGGIVRHPILLSLKNSQQPGLIVFSSGSTGKSKAAVHNFAPLLEKFKTRRHAKRTITFLQFDHLGGLNTLLHTLSNGGCVVTLQSRTADSVCASIERHKVQILPTSPTFLSLLLLSQAYSRYDLSSLELITYGTEVMPESTLQKLVEVLPGIRLQQTYGLSELGVMRSRSRANDSLWVEIGGEGFQTRVVDGLLEIKARSVMLGYLNAPTPLTEDGWFKTGDLVEVDGDYLRILGRASELVNVGGEKVYPAEVESALQSMDGVEEAMVTGEPNPISGQMVVAHVRLSTCESLSEFRKRMHAFLRQRLPRTKIPAKVLLTDRSLHSSRFKKLRHDVTSTLESKGIPEAR